MRAFTKGYLAAVVGCLFLGGSALRAELIDFEVGFVRLDSVSTVVTSTNGVTFSTEGAVSVTPRIAQVGTTPKDAFENVVDGVVIGDTPRGGNPGQFFLTAGAGNLDDYLFDLAQPVSQFGLDLYDYVGDGGAAPTDYATLRAYADAARTEEVASAVWVVPRPRPTDGLTVSLEVSAPSIVALTLDFSTPDRGTGIDNIRFVTVPEPSTIGLAVLAMAGTLLWGWSSVRIRSRGTCRTRRGVR